MQSIPEWAFHVPANLTADVDELGSGVRRLKTGETSEAQFRALRVPMGVYEQRESGTYMLRVRFPAGGMLPAQMRCLAEVSKIYGNGSLHVTTRQDIQVHGVPLDAIHPALAVLANAGLASKGGGGNTVRNITCCCNAGACRDEIFDVTPFAIAITERLMADSVSFQLPRKYKIAFSGCPSDCAGASVSDVGLVAREQGGIEGFAVYVGGGMGNKSRTSNLLHDFVEASEAYLIAEAVKRVFDKHGDRKNKNKARLRFLVESIGFRRFRKLYESEFAALRATNPESLQVRPFPQPTGRTDHRRSESQLADPTAYERWRRSNVKPQKQAGFFRADIDLPLGDIEASTMGTLADIVAEHGDGLLWATQAQNLAARSLSELELPGLQAELAPLRLAVAQPPVLRNLVACAGASTCRLGVCLSRGLAKAVSTSLLSSDLDLEKVGDLRIHVSGCPNSCARHLVADIGLHGAARRTASGLVPHYVVSLGGRTKEGQARLAAGCGTIPAKNVPHFIVDLLKHWTQAPDNTSLHDFLDQQGRKVAKNLLRLYREPPALEGDKLYHSDWDSDEPFSLAGRGAGECGAGVFDLIEVDLTSAFESLKTGKLYAATVTAARALLVTRGKQPKTDLESLGLFRTHFVAEGLVDRAFDEVIEVALLIATTPTLDREFALSLSEVTGLIEAVRSLYDSMDASLQFKPAPRLQSSQAQVNLDH